MRRESDPADLDRLAREAAAGDEVAFEALVRAVFRRVHRWARVRLRDGDEADEVTQRVLIRLHAGLGDWEGRGRFTSWLYRVTANEAASLRRGAARRRRRRERAAGRIVEPAARGPEDLDRRRLAELARAGFEKLPSRQREIMDLVDFQGYAPAEVAEMLDMNGNTVRANLFKARRALRAHVLEARPDARESLP